MSIIHRMSPRLVLAAAVLALLAGCSTKFDYNGNPIYFLQYGQPTDNAVDYTNPRLPILPRGRPVDPLWNIPNPYDYNDLSRYSFLTTPPPDVLTARLGDNGSCASTCASNAIGVRMLARADVGDYSRLPVIR
jgi:hypothetical protein